MKQKHYHLLQVCCYGAVSLFFLSMPLWAEITETGLGYSFLFLITITFIYLTFKQLKQFREANEEDRAYAPAADATTEEQIAFYKKYIYLSLICFPILSLIIIFDLNDLEAGPETHVNIWEPVAFLYSQFGYWTAILTVPLLGISITLLGVRKVQLLKKG